MGDGLGDFAERRPVGVLHAGQDLSTLFSFGPWGKLRDTLPRYITILGWKHGSRVMYITTLLSLAARGMVLAGVMMFYS
jgi:hypothetical protein